MPPLNRRGRRGRRFLSDLFDDDPSRRFDPDLEPAETGGVMSRQQYDPLEARRRRLRQARRQMRFDPSSVERPQFNERRERINQIVTGAGAVGSLVAGALGSEIGAAAGAGLAQGGAENLRRQREGFARRREAVQETLREGQAFNRELALDELDREAGRIQEEEEARRERMGDERDFEQRKELERLRDELERTLTPAEKEEHQRDLQLLDERIAAQRALAGERQTRAEANRALAEQRRRGGDGRGDGRGGESTGFENLSTRQVRSLLDRSEAVLQRNPQTGEVEGLSTQEIQNMPQSAREALGLGGDDISQADIDRVAERINALRGELERRDVNPDRAPGGPQAGPGPGGPGIDEVTPADRRRQAAQELLDEGVITREEYEAIIQQQ